MHTVIRLCAALALSMGWLAHGAHAGALDEIARQALLEQAELQFPGAELQVVVQDAPAAASRCEQPQAFVPHPDRRLLGRVTVGVQCASGAKRYLQAQISATGSYWVAAVPLAAGDVIDAGALTERIGALEELPRGAITDPSQVIGLEATRSIAEGTTLQHSHLRAPRLVLRQRMVTVEAQGPGFRVTRQGQALQDGGAGEPVRVRMPDRSILTAVVSGAGKVSVRF